MFLAWTGALASLIWLAVGLALAATVAARIASGLGPILPLDVLAGVLPAVVFSLAAWGASPSLPGGDEPHYLVITQSLLRDGDLKIENNHQRGDYREYFAGDLAPHSVRRGRNGEIYSIHAPGVPALIAPAFAIAGYHGAVVFLILLSAAGCALAWRLAWRASGSVPGGLVRMGRRDADGAVPARELHRVSRRSRRHRRAHRILGAAACRAEQSR